MQRFKLIACTSILLIAGVAGFAAAKDRDDDKGKRGQRRAAQLEKYDADQDGELDKDERAAMKKDRMAARFKKLDTNKDGVLSLEEFSKSQDRRGRRGKHNRP